MSDHLTSKTRRRIARDQRQFQVALERNREVLGNTRQAVERYRETLRRAGQNLRRARHDLRRAGYLRRRRDSVAPWRAGESVAVALAGRGRAVVHESGFSDAGSFYCHRMTQGDFPAPPPASTVLSGAEACAYFESLSEGRREMVWVRCARLLGQPFGELDPEDEGLDEAWDEVVTEMWCADQLTRLVDLGKLERQTMSDGKLLFISPA